MIKRIIVMVLVLASWPVNARASSPQVCIEYARSIASERRVSIGYENIDAWIYQQDCGSKVGKSESEESLQIGIPDIIDADGQGGRRARKTEKWCKENEHLSSAEVLSYDYHDKIVKPALDVLRSCVDAHAAKIRVEPTLSPDRTVLDVSLTNNTPSSELFVSAPSIRGEASCELLVGEAEESNRRVRLPLNRSVTYNCKRPSPIPDEGLPEAVISIASDGLPTPVQLQLPPISPRRLNSVEFDTLSRRLAQLGEKWSKPLLSPKISAADGKTTMKAEYCALSSISTYINTRQTDAHCELSVDPNTKVWTLSGTRKDHHINLLCQMVCFGVKEETAP